MAEGQPEKKKSKKLIIIVAGAVVLLACGGAAFMMKGKGGAEGETHVSTSDEIAGDAHGGGHGNSDGHGATKEDGHGGGHGGEEIAAAEANAEPETIFSFDQPFVVNLMDTKGRYFLQLLMEVEATTPEGVGRLEKNIAPLRDTAIMLLSSKSKDEMSTTEGKLRLKQELIMRMDSIVGPGTIKTIYFTDFSIHYS